MRSFAKDEWLGLCLLSLCAIRLLLLTVILMRFCVFFCGKSYLFVFVVYFLMLVYHLLAINEITSDVTLKYKRAYDT